MSIKNVNFKIDSELKDSAEKVIESMGLTMSSAIRMFLKQVVNRRQIPFTIEAEDPFYNELNQQVLAESIAKMERGEKFERDLIRVD